jgi:hypothetical protein
MDADSELIPRTNLLDEFSISDSCERRRRKEGADWPPHVLIGRKVYYRRKSLSDWLRQRESATQSVEQGLDRIEDAEALTAALRKANVLGHAAPALTADQAEQLRNLLTNEAGVGKK